MVAQQKMKEEEVTEVGADATVAPSGAKQPGSPKSRLAMLKRSTAKKAAAAAAATDPFRFQGNGVSYKGKLIGVRDVEAARGDTMCADAMRDAKAAVKAAGAHKQRVQLSINIDGIKISDEKATMVLHTFPVARISFIARDTTDARAFGFVFGEPDGKYKFYGIKTAQTADHAVLAIRDMFQIVYEMKRKQVEQIKLEKEDKDKKEMEDNGIRSENGVLVADLLDLETELQHYELGVNQLAHIPVVAGDEWPGESPLQQQPAAAAADAFGGSSSGAALIDAFGQQPFAGTPRAAAAPADPFGASFLSAGSSFGTTPNGAGTAPFGGAAGMYGAGAPAAHTPAMWGMSPIVGATPASHNGHHNHSATLHHGYSTSTPNFSETNPFATSASPMFYAGAPQNTPVMQHNHFMAGKTPVVAAAADPFDTSAFTSPSVNWNLENTAPSSVGSSIPHAHSFQATFSDMRTPSAPVPIASSMSASSHQWDQPARKVSSLEEAFTKLVDMNSLVSQPTTKKNPFEHLINPPKVPLNALSSQPAPAPCGVSAASPAGPTLIFPGKTNDPFADDFFN
ncbi:hypothetical protein PFISCL1PPCAC_5070 [Pristionchus fissidentatus]|uniref:PID domain-containing protein n=1 Tax=Pristionchus fissidentatus TaxID=1538716 RepID=A0AAV5V3U3_9BILA|nr:hypothetical protein PFISCL1PPCAC_5070 [Pristionchus fissidentatus]